jgi:hypothetical protein
MVGDFLLKSKLRRPKLKYLVRNRRLRRLFSPWRLREFHALYAPSAGPDSEDLCVFNMCNISNLTFVWAIAVLIYYVTMPNSPSVKKSLTKQVMEWAGNKVKMRDNLCFFEWWHWIVSLFWRIRDGIKLTSFPGLCHFHQKRKNDNTLSNDPSKYIKKSNKGISIENFLNSNEISDNRASTVSIKHQKMTQGKYLNLIINKWFFCILRVFS